MKLMMDKAHQLFENLSLSFSCLQEEGLQLPTSLAQALRGFHWEQRSGQHLPPSPAHLAAVMCLHAQSCFFATPWNCSPPDSSVHGILQARILEWLAKPSSRGLCISPSNLCPAILGISKVAEHQENLGGFSSCWEKGT